MKIIIKPQGTMAIYEQIVNQLKNAIVNRDLKPGEALPSIASVANVILKTKTLQEGYTLQKGGTYPLLSNNSRHCSLWLLLHLTDRFCPCC